MSNFSVRPFNPSDEEYAAVVSLYNSSWPDERHWPVAAWQRNDEEWPESALNQRFVVECDGQIAGLGACYEQYWQHQPGTFHIEFDTRPDQQDQLAVQGRDLVDQLLQSWEHDGWLPILAFQWRRRIARHFGA